MKEYERLAAKSNNFRKVSNLSDDEREFLKQLQEQYVVDVPDDVDVEKVKSRQAEMHRNSLKENTQEIRDAIQNFNNLSEEQQLEILEKVGKSLNQKKDWASKNVEEYYEIHKDYFVE